MSTISVVITSSSRPQLFPFMWKSFKKMLFFRETPYVIVHEDFVFTKESNEVMSYLNSLKTLGEIHEVYFHNPAIGLGYSLDYLINSVIKTDYILYIQEDWCFERPIDIDQIVWVMDENPNINLIFFNKSLNFETLNGELQPQYTYSGIDLCLYHSWTFLPGVWRCAKVRQHWRTRKERHEGYFTNSFGTHEQRQSIEYCEKNLGAYMLGQTGDYRYARHIGNDWRMESWRREKDGQPGGIQDTAIMDLPHMAPWVMLEDTPIRKQTYTKEEFEKHMEDEPIEYKKWWIVNDENTNCPRP